MRKNTSAWSIMAEAPMAWDTSDVQRDAPSARNPRRPPPIPVKVKDASGRPVASRGLPGVARNEAAPSGATPFTSPPPDRRVGDRRRGDKPTRELFVQGSFDVTVPGQGTFRVPAQTADAAKQAVVTWLEQDSDSPDHPTGGPIRIDPTQLTVARSPKEEGVGAGALGGQPQTPIEDSVREAVHAVVREVVRKKKGGGGYVLYGPNPKKKKRPKPSGTFPTRLAAKRAELSRFPPKDPEQLKRAKARLDKLAKNPKVRADDIADRRKPKRSGHAQRDRKKTKSEQLVRSLARDIHERLFHEDEVPGSPWDERISAMHPDVLASDKKLSGFHKGMEAASIGALGDAHKGLSKALRGMAKVQPGDIAHDSQRGKTFMPVTLDCDGVEVGPVHLYIDGGHVKIEVSQDARQQIADMDPIDARDLRGGLMSFEEEHLPKIDKARRAWADRDEYLDKLHGKLEKHANGLSGVEHHIMRQLLAKGGRR